MAYFTNKKTEITNKRTEIVNAAGDTSTKSTLYGELTVIYIGDLIGRGDIGIVNSITFETYPRLEEFIEYIKEDIVALQGDEDLVEERRIQVIGTLVNELNGYNNRLLSLLYQETDLAVLEKNVKLRRAEAELFDELNLFENDKRGDIMLRRYTYRRDWLAADLKSMTDLFNEYTFAFNTRFKLEKDKNRNLLEIQRANGEMLSPDAGDSRHVLFTSDSTWENLFTSQSTINTALREMESKEFYTEWLLFLKYQQVATALDEGRTENDSDKYFYALKEIEVYDNFIKKLQTESEGSETINLQKQKEHTNRLNAIDQQEIKYLDCIKAEYRSLARQLVADYRKGKLDKRNFEYRIELLLVRK